MSLIITRFADHPKLGCPGELHIDGQLLGISLEREYNDNKPYISSVPCGTYTLIPHYSKRYGDVFIMVNPELNVYALKEDRLSETDRFKCYAFHLGSYKDNFQGCIGVGQYYTLINNEMGISNTRDTSKAVNAILRTEGITELTIQWKHSREGKPQGDIFPDYPSR